jgi:SOS response regulatory protein OraA/RecX
MTKGISRQVIDNVLTEYVSDEDQRKAAAHLAGKRLKLAGKRFSKLDPLKRKKRLTDFLLRRGFSNEVVLKTVRNLLS